MTRTADEATAWADKIDERWGPISGSDADRLARFLRQIAAQLSSIQHPTGSEMFANHLARLGIPAPWSLCDENCGEILAANKAVACMALDVGSAVPNERATQAAMWIICAVNTLAGFKAEIAEAGR